MARALWIVGTLVVLAACAAPSSRTSADLVLTNGDVYLGRDGHGLANSVAIVQDRIAYVGDAEGAQKFIDAKTRVIDLGGRLLLPGLHDVHLHLLGIVPSGNCDLDSQPLSLNELVPHLKRCVEQGLVSDSGWLVVSQWNFTSGNQPSADYPSMRAALDAVSDEIPIILLGNDGHHGAANSATLKRAKNADGATLGLSRESLEEHFARYRQYVGVDAQGRPNGYINESARNLFDAPTGLLWDLPSPSVMPAIAKKLASNGITTVRDASATIPTLAHYDQLYASGAQTFRLTLALFPDFDSYRNGESRPDIDSIVRDFETIRKKYQSNALIRADTVKIFVDGVLEGDPLATPPTLPNAAQLMPYRQPRFSRDPGGGAVSIVGYVDLDSDVCRGVRARPRGLEVEAFIERHGFHPSQCTVSNGVLEHPVDFIEDYIGAFDAAGFTVHAHAIGDRAVRTAIDAFSKTRRDRGRVVRPHGIGHAQLVHPDDIPRVGELGLNVAFTFAWIIPDPDYDLTVTPFVDQVSSQADFYSADNYTFRYGYPVASLYKAGALVTAGSDAPVDTREPRPFVNIEQAVTRADESGRAFNAAEAIDIYAALDAYTANGAIALNQAEQTGTIEVGKKADLALVDQNVIKLAQSGRASELSDTRVLLTVFDGKVVFTAPEFGAN